MKLSLRISAMFIAALSVIFMGCLHGDENSSLTSRLTAAEAELSTTKTELSTVRGELSTVRGELSTIQGDLTDAEDALSECQDTGLGILKIEHNGVNAIYDVYISPTTSDEWGRDWLDEVGVIFVGRTRYFVLLPGTYDLKVVFSGGHELESVITISPGEITTKRYVPA